MNLSEIFDSLVQLEYEHRIPRNAFFNAGAINVTDALISYLGNSTKASEEIFQFVRDMSDEILQL